MEGEPGACGCPRATMLMGRREPAALKGRHWLGRGICTGDSMCEMSWNSGPYYDFHGP